MTAATQPRDSETGPSTLKLDNIRLVAPISTGSLEIDKRIGGGLPRHSFTLVEGQSDAGKSVVLQQLCWGAMNASESVALYTTENTVRSLLRQMSSLGMDCTDYFLLKRFRIVPVGPEGMEPAQPAQPALGHVPDTRAGRRWALLDHLRESTYDVLLIDSLTSMLMHATDREVLDLFAGCKRLCDEGKTIVVSVHTHAFEQSLLVRVRSLCDAHLHLRIEQVGEQLIKVMEVAKVRGAERSTGNVVSFDVEPGLGMKLIPVTKAKA
jgi:flagellar protein FlaH